MYNPPLVPEDFVVPEVLETDRLRLRPLTIHHAVKDFDAVASSEERLRKQYDPDGEWPSGLTLEQNIVELGWHQTEFQQRTSFAYTVLNLDESEVMGCVYIYPSPRADYDVQVKLWVRQSRVAEGLDVLLANVPSADRAIEGPGQITTCRWSCGYASRGWPRVSTSTFSKRSNRG